MASDETPVRYLFSVPVFRPSSHDDGILTADPLSTADRPLSPVENATKEGAIPGNALAGRQQAPDRLHKEQVCRAPQDR